MFPITSHQQQFLTFTFLQRDRPVHLCFITEAELHVEQLNAPSIRNISFDLSDIMKLYSGNNLGIFELGSHVHADQWRNKWGWQGGQRPGNPRR